MLFLFISSALAQAFLNVQIFNPNDSNCSQAAINTTSVQMGVCYNAASFSKVIASNILVFPQSIPIGYERFSWRLECSTLNSTYTLEWYLDPVCNELYLADSRRPSETTYGICIGPIDTQLRSSKLTCSANPLTPVAAGLLPITTPKVTSPLSGNASSTSNQQQTDAFEFPDPKLKNSNADNAKKSNAVRNLSSVFVSIAFIFALL